MVTGCATRPPADDPEAVAAFIETNDPYEPLNRQIFEVNMFLDRVVLKPVAYVYKEAMPAPAKSWIANALNNFKSPVTLINDLMQGEFNRANDTFVRLMINTGFGLGGILDIATEFGIPDHDEDFGQTLSTWGMAEGPYLMLPFLGPSNPRDLLGFVVDTAFDPGTYVTYVGDVDNFGVARTAGSTTSSRAARYDQINELQKSSLDFYAAVRSLYRQKRNDEIRNGRPALSRGPMETEASPAEATVVVEPVKEPSAQ